MPPPEREKLKRVAEVLGKRPRLPGPPTLQPSPIRVSRRYVPKTAGARRGLGEEGR